MLASVGMYVLRAPMRLLTPVLIGPLAFWLWSHRLATIPLGTAWGLGLLFLGEEFADYCIAPATRSVGCGPRTSCITRPNIFTLQTLFASGPPSSCPGIGCSIFHSACSDSIRWLSPACQPSTSSTSSGCTPISWAGSDRSSGFFNTPSHHRVHHASNCEYLDRNYGGILIIWDRLFGTFAQEQLQTEITYGLVHPVGSLNPVRIAFHEWGALARDLGRARSWRERLRQLFGRPGDSLASLAQGPCPRP
jgi:hypothetical protein